MKMVITLEMSWLKCLDLHYYLRIRLLNLYTEITRHSAPSIGQRVELRLSKWPSTCSADLCGFIVALTDSN